MVSGFFAVPEGGGVREGLLQPGTVSVRAKLTGQAAVAGATALLWTFIEACIEACSLKILLGHL